MELYRALFKAAIRPLSTPLPISSVRDRIAILLFAVYGKKTHTHRIRSYLFIYGKHLALSKHSKKERKKKKWEKNEKTPKREPFRC